MMLNGWMVIATIDSLPLAAAKRDEHSQLMKRRWQRRDRPARDLPAEEFEASSGVSKLLFKAAPVPLRSLRSSITASPLACTDRNSSVSSDVDPDAVSEVRSRCLPAASHKGKSGMDFKPNATLLKRGIVHCHGPGPSGGIWEAEEPTPVFATYAPDVMGGFVVRVTDEIIGFVDDWFVQLNPGASIPSCRVLDSEIEKMPPLR